MNGNPIIDDISASNRISFRINNLFACIPSRRDMERKWGNGIIRNNVFYKDQKEGISQTTQGDGYESGENAKIGGSNIVRMLRKRGCVVNLENVNP